MLTSAADEEKKKSYVGKLVQTSRTIVDENAMQSATASTTMRACTAFGEVIARKIYIFEISAPSIHSGALLVSYRSGSTSSLISKTSS